MICTQATNPQSKPRLFIEKYSGTVSRGIENLESKDRRKANALNPTGDIKFWDNAVKRFLIFLNKL